MITLCTILVLAAWNVKAQPSHEEGHNLFHEYYQYWYNKRGTHCCDEQHCRPGEFRWNPEVGWEVQLRDGSWYKWKDTDQVKGDGGLGPFGSICDSWITINAIQSGVVVFCVDPPEAGV